MKSQIIMRYPTSWNGEMWREGAPCGNGVVGALVYGGAKCEIIAINHAKLWRGGRVQIVPDVHESIQTVREYLDKERPDLADSVLTEALMEKGYYPEFATPLPLCDIRINRISEAVVSGYRRFINLEKAEVVISWKEGEVQFSRQVFVSRADGITYIKLSASKGGMINIEASLDIHDTETMTDSAVCGLDVKADGDCIYYSCDNDSAYKPSVGKYGALMRVMNFGGEKEIVENKLRVTGADEVILAADVFVGKSGNIFARSEEKLTGLELSKDIYENALDEHILLHQKLYGGVDFSISEKNDTSNEEMLLEAFDTGASNELIETMYAYGRYLFTCSTDAPDRADVMPTHLVGLWNGTYRCFWAFHMFNVNFEMIYWQALSGGQPELLRTALDYIEGFIDDFRENAKNVYGCRGINVYSVNTPESGHVQLHNHIINWTTGAAWVAEHFYDYYRYTGDKKYLAEHALPFMAEVALFFEDFLTKDKNGKLEFSPSTSPENTASSVIEKYRIDIQVSKNASMDIALIRGLLQNCLEASDITGEYAEKREKWLEIISSLPDYKYNSDSSLKEWADNFYTDNNHHRHHSHLYGVFPGRTVTKNSPEWEHFIKAEDNRMKEGLTSQSSWSMVYMAGVNARLGRGNEAYFALSEMARYCTMNNLFTLHNDWRRMGSVSFDDIRIAPFQIDANIGLTGVVNEMLVSSVDDSVILFPALPDKWESGKLCGVSSPAGCKLELFWNKTSADVQITPQRLGEVRIVCLGNYVFDNGDNNAVINFTEIGEKITLKLSCR